MLFSKILFLLCVEIAFRITVGGHSIAHYVLWALQVHLSVIDCALTFVVLTVLLD